ncbi:MAG: MBL fold metallo-hydrolase [Verrucomicrobia bacterium]|nr:MBL fold metallo-hydrolase [Verrucomicrobiota bacterium]MBV9642721.1 MBL fold metallo-hydrolase [Verrucomicrobiota bacterium]
MLHFQTFIGGIFDTNAYLIQTTGGNILIDAPTGSSEWIRSLGVRLDLLVLTHGHPDHFDDAARIKRTCRCQVAFHKDGIPLMTDPDFFKKRGFFLEAEPVQPDFLIEETLKTDLCGIPFRVLHVPGHCPGSLCFYSAEDQLLFDGDVLFAGSVGRTDFPGGDHSLLIRGIREKVLTLPDETTVLPGHGPQTTIGEERRHNTFLQ